MKGPDLNSYEADILARDLDVIFCGVNPAMTAAVAGHNFSSRSNRFWTVLHLAGFTDVRLQPAEERRLLEYRCGLTAVVERPTRRAIDVPPDEFRKAQPGLETKVRRYAPRSVAFLGKRAFLAMMDQPDVAWGRYPAGFAGTTAWLLPNPSGLNKAFSLEALVNAYSESAVRNCRATPFPSGYPGSTVDSRVDQTCRNRGRRARPDGGGRQTQVG
jgi:TDG/mug DNA glycosylase family protein